MTAASTVVFRATTCGECSTLIVHKRMGGRKPRLCPTHRLARKNEVSERSRRRRLYGVTDDKLAEMLAVQGGVCKICKCPETCMSSAGVVRELSVDHDHETGDVRGLLCFACNSGLGRFGDSAARLRAAAEYLEVGHAGN